MKKRFRWVLASVWLAAMSIGTGALVVYEYIPGRDGGIPSAWPLQSKIPHATDQPTLVMFAHPDCPCTRASIGELTELITHCRNKVKAYVLFLQPKGTGKNWLDTDLWRSAAAIPGVVVQADEEGNEARRFQATTSGQVVLYDAGGKLLFRGGITSSRGHYGDSAGLSAIITMLHGGKAAPWQTPVFGCSLLDPKPAVLTGSTACTR